MNPYCKDVGSSHPTIDNDPRKFEGRSWILQSYKRALEQAKQQNKSFREVAEKQWGSVEKIHSLLKSAGIDPPYECPSKQLYSCSDNDQLSENHTCNSLESSGCGNYSSSSFLRPGEDNIDFGSSASSNWQIRDKLVKAPEPSNVGTINKTEIIPVDILEDDNITESMVNSVSAKLLKAEILGHDEKRLKLQHELDTLRSRKKLQDSRLKYVDHKEKAKSDGKTVLLTTTDKFGRTRPAGIPLGKHLPGHLYKGKSRKHFTDSDCSMKALIEQERKLTADDTLEAIANMAAKFVRTHADDTVDDVLDWSVKSDSIKDDSRTKQKILSQSTKMEEIISNCKLCVGSHSYNKNVLIAMGMNVYLSVPSYQSLTEYHCLLVPLEHTACSLQLDENVWSEIELFQKGLTRMFSDCDMDVIFSECYTCGARRSHMYIDCIPIPKAEGCMAQMYFKKAIMESDTEWAQNKKLIDTSEKGVRRSIPLGLPYFFVNFNHGGYAHVIEDSSLFPHYFAKEVIGGLIDAEPNLWLKPKYESFEQQIRKASKLKEKWNPYDWTKKLGSDEL